jgi:uncharacterized protein (TIGR03437 family)
MKVTVQTSILLWLLAGPVHGGTVFSAILSGSGQEYATSVASDAQGNVYVAGLTYSPDFPVTAGAFQTTFGGTSDAFIAKVGPDGKLLWSTYLGGILDDWATGVALDSAGNVLVTGYTRSANFPLANPIRSVLDNGASDDYDAFVAKLDPNGAKLLYSTFLGGAADDGPAGIALDSAGNAYVAVSTNSTTGYPGTQTAPNQFGIFVSKLNPMGALVYSFFHQYGAAAGIALDAGGNVYVTGTSNSTNPGTATKSFGAAGTNQAMVFKISPDGSNKLYETRLGGSVKAAGTAIAVDSAGEVDVAGSTSSVDFPLVKPLQSSPGARPLWKSADSGTTFAPADNLPFALPQMMVVDPTTPTTLYEATGDLGVFKSVDGGATWTAANSGIAATNIQALAIDPVHPQTLYAATGPAPDASSITVYKTVNGAGVWMAVDSPASPQLAVDAQNPNIVWEIGSTLRKSTDAGATWKPVTFPGSVQSLVLDPRVSGNVFAISSPVFCGFQCSGGQPGYFYRSVDGGADWIQEPLPAPSATRLLVDGSTNPSTVFDGLGARSVDGGITFMSITPPPGASSSSTIAVDITGTLYVAVAGQGNYLSRDHAQTWTAIGSFIPPWRFEAFGPVITSIVPAGSTGTLYATTNQIAASGFVTKLSADGSSIVYSTYLRGHASMESYNAYAAEPGVFLMQNWISAIAIDAGGNATVAGGTRAVDFPTANPAQAAGAGLADAFLTTISADGGKLNYSTYFGGSQDDGALAAALDSQGNAIFAGQTFSGDFPVPGGAQLPFSYGNAFVVKLATSPPAISAVANAASNLSGTIAPGEIVVLFGTGFGPAQLTSAHAGSDGLFDAQLAGTSVQFNGISAPMIYTSSTQVAAIVPYEVTGANAQVTVTYQGQISAPITAGVAASAPALFTLDSTGQGQAAAVNQAGSINTSSVPAPVGSIISLYATGEGQTSPAGVDGKPATTPLPTPILPVNVTIGGVTVDNLQYVGGAPGEVAGLLQINVQIPAGILAGSGVPVLIRVGSAGSQAGVTIAVSAN